MYTLLISSLMGLVVFAAVAVGFDPVAAVVPAILATIASLVALFMRVRRMVDAEIQQTVPMFEKQQIDEARAHLERIRARHAKWMPGLSGQLDAQLGMIEYFQLKFDKARPLLENGSWRNWMAMTCLGVIHFRKSEHDRAWEWMDKALSVGSKEQLVYGVYVVLLTRVGKRDEALAVLARGLEAMPESSVLKELRNSVANKRKVRTELFGEAWYQFFPEELAARQHMMARRRGPMPAEGFRGPKMNKQTRRGR